MVEWLSMENGECIKFIYYLIIEENKVFMLGGVLIDLNWWMIM